MAMKLVYILLGGALVVLAALLGYSALSDRTGSNGSAYGTSSETDLSIGSTEPDANATTMSDVGETTRAVLKTNQGDITVELFTEKMPITAGNFLKLAKENFYDGVKFHRVIEGFMIQGGDPLSKDDAMKARWGTGGPGYAIEDEFVEGFSNVAGTLSMANAGPNSGGSQFFINVADNTFLDFDKPPAQSKHPVFGRVVEGMDVAMAISETPTGPNDVPVDPVVIEDIVVE